MEKVMRRLVLHLGLPKTATKSLQAHIFPQLPGYLGRNDTHRFSVKFSSSALDEFVRLYNIGVLVNGKRVFEIDGRPVWLAALHKWVDELIVSNEEILFVSFEGFSAWPSEGNIAGWPMNDPPGSLARQGSHPCIHFLDTLHQLLPSHIELKTILTLRNQCDWLGSLAAQMKVSDTTFVERLIKANDAFLDYELFTKGLERLRSKEQHITLFFENGLEYNIKQILCFSGYSDAVSENLHVFQARENVRNSKVGWSIRGTSVADRLEIFLHDLRNQTPFLKRLFGSENLLLKRTIYSVLGLFNRIPFMKKSAKIYLSTSQKNKIKMHCKLSNERLGKHLNQDLTSLGY